MKITKAQVLKAIATETLTPGPYVADGPCLTSSICTVCAVGAVLRSQGLKDHQIKLVASETCRGEPNRLNRDLSLLAAKEVGKRLIKKRRYFNALSIVFEHLCLEYVSPSRRKTALSNFVQRHFPKTFTVDTSVLEA